MAEEDKIPDPFRKAKLKEHVNIHVLGNVIAEFLGLTGPPLPSVLGGWVEVFTLIHGDSSRVAKGLERLGKNKNMLNKSHFHARVLCVPLEES